MLFNGLLRLLVTSPPWISLRLGIHGSSAHGTLGATADGPSHPFCCE